MPGAVAALDASLDPKAIVQSVLTGMVDAICRDAARRAYDLGVLAFQIFAATRP